MVNVSSPLHFKPYEKIENFKRSSDHFTEGKVVHNLTCGMNVIPFPRNGRKKVM